MAVLTGITIANAANGRDDEERKKNRRGRA